jgi:hypothetical protein
LFYDKEDYSFFGFSALIVSSHQARSSSGIDTLTQYSRSRSRFGLAAAMVESGYGRANDIDK